MANLNTSYFAAALNMSPHQIQELFSPVAPGHYVSNLVFAPSATPQDPFFNAIEALRNLTPISDKNILTMPLAHMLLAHG